MAKEVTDNLIQHIVEANGVLLHNTKTIALISTKYFFSAKCYGTKHKVCLYE